MDMAQNNQFQFKFEDEDEEPIGEHGDLAE